MNKLSMCIMRVCVRESVSVDECDCETEPWLSAGHPYTQRLFTLPTNVHARCVNTLIVNHSLASLMRSSHSSLCLHHLLISFNFFSFFTLLLLF